MSVGSASNGESVFSGLSDCAGARMSEGEQDSHLSPDRSRHTCRRIYCPHCSEYLSKSGYYRHRETYYNAQEHRWRTEPCNDSTDSESCDSDMSVPENSLDVSEMETQAQAYAGVHLIG